MDERLRAVVVLPGQPAEIKSIDGSLAGLQGLVGGYIQCITPYDDAVGLICNEDGKSLHMPYNRALRDKNGEPYDVLAGPFALVGLTGDSFCSLSDAQAARYVHLYQVPEKFEIRDGKIIATPKSDPFLDFEAFRSKLIDDLKSAFKAQGRNLAIKPRHVDKPDASYDGISVTDPTRSKVMMCINIGAAYQQLSNISYEEVLTQLEDTIQDGLNNFPAIDVSKFTDYDYVRNNLVVDVISKRGNEDFLKTIPHTPIVGDLVVIYRIQIGDNASTVITDDMRRSYGVSAEQLHYDAVKVAEKSHPIVIKSIVETLGDLSPEPVPGEPMLYVVNAAGRTAGGAGVLAYDDFADRCTEVIGNSFYILPSSKHELLIIDDTSMDREQLEAMVQGVNAAEVLPEDKLADTVFHYDISSRMLETARDFEARVAKKSAPEYTPVVDNLRRKGR